MGLVRFLVLAAGGVLVVDSLQAGRTAEGIGLGLLTAAIDQIIGIIARVERDQREERRRK